MNYKSHGGIEHFKSPAFFPQNNMMKYVLENNNRHAQRTEIAIATDKHVFKHFVKFLKTKIAAISLFGLKFQCSLHHLQPTPCGLTYVKTIF